MPHQDDYVVSLSDIVFRRGKRVIFDGMNVNIPRGKVVAIMGPSGCGKTTLLRLIGGQLQPDEGQVMAFGQNVPMLNRDQLYRVRRKMGMLFQSGALFSDLNVFDNVAFSLREHTDMQEALIRDLVLMKLESVGLRGAYELMPNELSGGMARRAALARAIALDPELIMYDEPFAGQDPISMGVVVQLIRLLNDALGMTTILVSHDVQETMSIADYVYVIADGRVVESGSPEALRNSDSAWVNQFIHGLPDGPVPFHYPARDYADDLTVGAASA